ncbi:uncharacterized protein GIQ15_03663 [Arthroderma uncinatum]|uniref:uncharacterized protein n=1 Tax=Arthroderma uncinatum TaxID=74035 RepID=UPI00144A83E6|nr:uncharacterized protein GIQ15_03663 [Arthroderma uncinatum]KAF3484339.1 hypothetical protein GIQ15_03663 [Arthroderma uncinatum]
MNMFFGYAVRAAAAVIVSTLPLNSEHLIPDYETTLNWLIEDNELRDILNCIGEYFSEYEDSLILSFFSQDTYDSDNAGFWNDQKPSQTVGRPMVDMCKRRIQWRISQHLRSFPKLGIAVLPLILIRIDDSRWSDSAVTCRQLKYFIYCGVHLVHEGPLQEWNYDRKDLITELIGAPQPTSGPIPDSLFMFLASAVGSCPPKSAVLFKVPRKILHPDISHLYADDLYM